MVYYNPHILYLSSIISYITQPTSVFFHCSYVFFSLPSVWLLALAHETMWRHETVRLLHMCFSPSCFFGCCENRLSENPLLTSWLAGLPGHGGRDEVDGREDLYRSIGHKKTWPGNVNSKGSNKLYMGFIWNSLPLRANPLLKINKLCLAVNIPFGNWCLWNMPGRNPSVSSDIRKTQEIILCYHSDGKGKFNQSQGASTFSTKVSSLPKAPWVWGGGVTMDVYTEFKWQARTTNSSQRRPDLCTSSAPDWNPSPPGSRDSQIRRVRMAFLSIFASWISSTSWYSKIFNSF